MNKPQPTDTHVKLNRDPLTESSSRLPTLCAPDNRYLALECRMVTAYHEVDYTRIIAEYRALGLNLCPNCLDIMGNDRVDGQKFTHVKVLKDTSTEDHSAPILCDWKMYTDLHLICSYAKAYTIEDYPQIIEEYNEKHPLPICPSCKISLEDMVRREGQR